MKKMSILLSLAFVIFVGLGTADAQSFGAEQDEEAPYPACKVYAENVPSQVEIQEGTVTCTVIEYNDGVIETWEVQTAYEGPGVYVMALTGFEPDEDSVFYTIAEVDIHPVWVYPGPHVSYYTAEGRANGYYGYIPPWPFSVTIDQWSLEYHDGSPSTE